MFRLEKLEIHGFKSFYDPAQLAFPAPMTAVVGPNGCGKSNICDAIIWVLGENRASHIRGETMDDVIFQGSARRRPLSMGEVTLTLGDVQRRQQSSDVRRRHASPSTAASSAPASRSSASTASASASRTSPTS